LTVKDNYLNFLSQLVSLFIVAWAIFQLSSRY
jgi:hypothetical protein